jgi:hypothetical protein
MPREVIDALAAESRRIEEDCEYSARSHFEAAGRWMRAHYWIGVPVALLAAVTGGSAIADHAELAAVLGLIVTALSAVAVFLNPSDRSTQHHAAGTRFNEVRNLARVFREIDLQVGDDHHAQINRLKELGSKRDELNKASPQISRWAFERGKRSIEKGEAAYSVDRARSTQELPRA